MAPNRTRARQQSGQQARSSEEQRSAVVVFDQKAASEKLVAALEQRRPQIESMLAADPDTAQRFLTVATDAIVRDRNLLEADLFSLVASVRHAAIMGLEPTSVMGEGAIVVYRDNDQGGKKIAQFQPMVRGLSKLARNSGEVAAIGVDVVREHDEFELRSGTDPGIVHRPKVDGSGGSMIGAYAYAKLRSGEIAMLYMTTAEIHKRRSVSKQFRSSGDNSIWGTWPEEMAKKTVLRRLLVEKVPLSFRAQRALALEAEIDSPGGDPSKVESVPLPGRTAARLMAHVDEPENASQPAQDGSGAAEEVEGVSKDATDDKGALGASGAGDPDPVCGKPGMREGATCQKPPKHEPPHGDEHGEWL